MVGGTSIGALMGALYCIDSDLDTFATKAKQFSDVRLYAIVCFIYQFILRFYFIRKEMSSIMPKILDLTYPLTSTFTGW